MALALSIPARPRTRPDRRGHLRHRRAVHSRAGADHRAAGAGRPPRPPPPRTACGPRTDGTHPGALSRHRGRGHRPRARTQGFDPGLGPRARTQGSDPGLGPRAQTVAALPATRPAATDIPPRASVPSVSASSSAGERSSRASARCSSSAATGLCSSSTPARVTSRSRSGEVSPVTMIGRHVPLQRLADRRRSRRRRRAPRAAGESDRIASGTLGVERHDAEGCRGRSRRAAPRQPWPSSMWRMLCSTCGSSSITSTQRAAGVARARPASTRRGAHLRGVPARHLDAEGGTAPLLRGHRQRQVHQLAEPAHDGEARAPAPCRGRARGCSAGSTRRTPPRAPPVGMPMPVSARVSDARPVRARLAARAR